MSRNEGSAGAVGVVVVGAGTGTRLGGVDKAFMDIAGRPMLAHSVATFESVPDVAAIVLVVAATRISDAWKVVRDAGWRKVIAVVPGGSTRQQSVANGLAALPDLPIVVIHDAARPIVDRDVVEAGIAAARMHGAAVAAIPVRDTLKRVGEDGVAVIETVDRAALWAAQTPQAFRTDRLLEAYQVMGDRAASFTDDAGIVEAAGFPVVTFPGSQASLKVTMPDDVEVVEALLARRAAVKAPTLSPSPAAAGEGSTTPSTPAGKDARGPTGEGSTTPSPPAAAGEGSTTPPSPAAAGEGSTTPPSPAAAGEGSTTPPPPTAAGEGSTTPPHPNGMTRTGTGYDVHRLAAGRPLVLGGVVVPHDVGCTGHSDGDALAHAVTDALLGACALGDIGRLFPPGDPRFKDADSIGLLRNVVGHLAAAGFSPASVDATVVLERPRLAPHVEAMRARLADAMGLDPIMVSVKAKTNEGLDAIGRGEAVAVHAIAVVSTTAPTCAD